MSDDLALLRLARTQGVGPVAFRRLMARYETPQRALDALPGLVRAAGGGADPYPMEAARQELSALARMGGRMLFWGQPGYPALLAHLDDAPPALAMLGDPAALEVPPVAIVGSRNASANGATLARTLAAEIAGRGAVVISGLARGIDTAAHEGALSAGGLTAACVAGGLDQPYPPENVALQDRIIGAGGCVVAEAPLGTAPQARHFPKRNRIIAGLSLGVVVVEAATRSGSLITARIAQDAGRELYAMPGSPLDPRCRGSNDLIRQGAHLTESAGDVFDHLPDDPRREGIGRLPMFRRALADGFGEPEPVWVEPEPQADLAAARRTVLELLGPSPTSVDALVRHCQLSAAVVQAVLLDLELALRVEMLPGNRVALLLEPEVRHLRP